MKMERNRVLITGLSREISRSDLTMYFQSRKKSGGGEVIDIEFLDQRKAILTFQNEVVANNVLTREHSINGFEIYTTVPPRNMERSALPLMREDSEDDTASDESSNSNDDETGDPVELCTVQVDYLSLRTTKDSIKNYFENRNKSIGGAVRKVELDNTLNMAKVVFCYQQDAERAARYKKHKLDEARLRVALVSPYEAQKKNKGKKETVSEKPREEELPLEFVISGISEMTTEDSLVNYLENTRRSGGGIVEDLKFDEEEQGIAEVKLRNVKSLDQLLRNQHRIDDAILQIEVKEPEKEVPSDPRKVHVKGLSPATTNDGLELYMEKMSKGDVVNLQRGSYGNALISFKDPIDFEKLAHRIENDDKGLEGRKLIPEQVPYCCCIQVSALDDKTTEDSLRLYFENPKRGCGIEPREVDLQGEGRALVYFDDHSVIEQTLGKKHVLEKAELQMELFYPFLNEEMVTKKRKTKEKKSEKIDIDPEVMAHISKRYGEELDDLLDGAGIELKWEPEEQFAVMTEKPGAVNKKEPWGKNIKFLQGYFHDFECERITVDDGAWDEVHEAVTQELVSTNDFSDADITTHESTKEIRVTGKRNCLQMAVSVVQTLVRGIQEDKALQDTIETKVERDLEPGKLALLKISSLHEDLQGSNKHLEMEIKEDDGEVIIKGPRKNLQEISIELYKFCSKVKEEVLELPERILGVLETPKGRDFVCKSLSQSQIQAVLVHGQRRSKNEASIFATNKDQARKATKHIESFSKERSIHLKEENIPVMKSEKWNELVTSIEARSVASVWFEERSQTIWISGVERDVLECFTVLENYIDNNTIVKDIVEVGDGCSRFIFQIFENEIRDLHAELRDSFVRIQPSACGEITITGTRKGIENSKKAVMSLVQRVYDEEIRVDKPGMKKLLKSSKGKKVIKAIEIENKCTVELIDLDQQELKTGSMEGLREGKRLATGEIICSYTTNKMKRLVVYKDDLTRHPVDVIVNAANENLQHVGGLARDIVRVGGQGIQDECNDYIAQLGALIEGHVMQTKPGHLPCKAIVHAVGPRWDSWRNRPERGSSRKEKILQFTFENCLESAKNYTSIAIPAVSSGIFGFPLDLCASILVETVVKFFQDNPHCNLSEVHFTNNDDTTVKAFSDEMKRRFGKERTFSEGKSKTPPGSEYDQKYETASTFLSASSSDKLLTTREGVSLFVKVGDITREKADVLVNTAGEDLKLEKNACARSFSKAAGPSLQRYCDNISPVKVGDIGATKPGKLKCQYVFHAVCGQWNSGKGEKILRDILQKCFNEAEMQGANSIAIPAIGTGILQFPRDDVARISFEEVILFSKRRPTSLKEVRFVLYDKDQLTIQAFRDELAKRSSRLTPPKRRTNRTTTSSTLTKRKDDWFEVDMDKLSVHVQRGDITQESTDAIVVVSNPDLDLTIGGGAGAAILKAGGPALAIECQQHPTLKTGSVSMTSAGRLQVSNLIHYVPLSNSLDVANLVTAVLKCLQFAEQKGLNSVSFPAVGTGNLDLSADLCAKAMLKAFDDFSKGNPTSVQLVRVVIFQKSMIKAFHSEMKEFVGEVPDRDEDPGFLRRLTNLVGLTSKDDREVSEIEHDESTEVVLRVYSGNQTQVCAAVMAIREMITENYKRQVLDNDAIAYLDQNHKRKMRTIERQFDCKIQVEDRVNRIIVEGNSEDVFGALSKIHEMLHEVIKRCEQAELLAKDVEWLCEAEGGFTPYSKESNAKIELAFKNKEKEVTFEENGEEFKICFSRKEEISKHGTAKVIRRAQGEISLPDNWDPQPMDRSSGTEVTVHLVDLDWRKHVQEYLKVSDLVKKTFPSSKKILKIQRVQNPAQYKIYAIRKQRMDEKNNNGNNEKMLFHGTQRESCDSINATGFNRSYAGKNATIYGQGVYFAVDAGYSARSNYSPPDSQGNRYMYLARVLTGEYTVGDQSMAVPPPKNLLNATDTYDTVVDDASTPNIFVVFYDGQSYPEYLITFQ